MKKVLMLMLSFLMALGAGLAKASSRTDAMSADINVVEDYDLIFTYPNKVLDYKNTVDFRMGSLTAGTSDDWGGILDGKFEQVGVIGVYLHRPNTDIMNGVSFSNLGDNEVLSNLIDYRVRRGYTAPGNPVGEYLLNEDIPSVNPLFDLFWGKEIAGLSLGVKLNYADNKDNSTEGEDYTALKGDVASDKSTSEARQIGLQVGLGKKNLGPFSEANLSVGYSMAKLNDSYQQSTADHAEDVYDGWQINGNNIYSANINLNLKHEIDENNNVKLFASFKVDNFGIKAVDQSSMYLTYPANRIGERETMAIETLGLGFNHTVNDGVALVSAGVKLNHGTWKESASSFMYGVDTVSDMRTIGDPWGYEIGMTEGWTELPVFVSVEAKVKSWLTLRAGASYYLFATETDNYAGAQVGSSESYSYAENITFSTGFGLNWKNFVLDGVFNTNDLENNIANVQPGRGLLFTGNLVTVTEADLKYKF
jgi:hypothetical protein